MFGIKSNSTSIHKIARSAEPIVGYARNSMAPPTIPNGIDNFNGCATLAIASIVSDSCIWRCALSFSMVGLLALQSLIGTQRTSITAKDMSTLVQVHVLLVRQLKHSTAFV